MVSLQSYKECTISDAGIYVNHSVIEGCNVKFVQFVIAGIYVNHSVIEGCNVKFVA